jgi:hypothetical protein
MPISGRKSTITAKGIKSIDMVRIHRTDKREANEEPGEEGDPGDQVVEEDPPPP